MTLTVIVCARDEADRIEATLAALPPARVIVVDDGSRDATGALAHATGAEVIMSRRRLGKGRAANLAAARVSDAIVLFCDADLGESAGELVRLFEAVAAGEADLAIGAFSQPDGFGIALRFARWAVRRRCGLDLQAPLSGQRALSPAALAAALPFAGGFGLEVGMTIDVARAGLRVREYPLALTHRPTGRTLRGFLHRGRQLIAAVAATASR